jgi:hypothetical protein
VLVATPEAIHRSNDKAGDLRDARRIGVPRAGLAARVGRAGRGRGGPGARLPGHRRLHEARLLLRVARVPRALGVGRTGTSSCSPTGPASRRRLRLEDLLDLLGDDPTELLVMELATGKERTIDGIAVEGRIALGHPKTPRGDARRASRCTSRRSTTPG